jgi:hypothetical protein
MWLRMSKQLIHPSRPIHPRVASGSSLCMIDVPLGCCSSSCPLRRGDYELRRDRKQAIATSLRRVSIRANSRASQTIQTTRSSQFGHGDGDGSSHSHLVALVPLCRHGPSEASHHTLQPFSLVSGVHNLRGARGVSICASDILVVVLTSTPPPWSCRAGTTA